MNSIESRTETILKTQLENTDAMAQANNPHAMEESLRLIDDLKYFLATAPANWQENQIIRRYYLNNEHGFVSCVFWNNVYYITGTDIVKCCLYRMEKFGRSIIQKKKFEEGIFSDLRNLKCGMDATLEQPKSEFLQFLYRNSCLKTQKKQKVFFWFSVPHDKLFTDALERDLKREETSKQQATTRAFSEPAISFNFDSTSGVHLYDQLLSHTDNKRHVVGSEYEIDPLSGLEPDVKSQSQFQSQLNNIPKEDNTISKDKPISSYDETSDKINKLLHSDSSSSTIRASEETLLPSENLVTLNSPMLKLKVEKDSKGISPEILDQEGPNEMKYSNSTSNKEINNTTENTTTFEDIPLDYFPIDIEYPDKDMPLEDSINADDMNIGDYGMTGVYKDSNKSKKHRKSINYSSSIADPFSLDQEDDTEFDPSNSGFVNSNMINSELEQDTINDGFNDINDDYDNFDNDTSQQRKPYYNPHLQYHPYMNLNIPQVPNYQSEIMPQTIEQQPFGRFDNLYTPQNVYKDYFHMAQSQAQPTPVQPQMELFDWNTLLQPTSSLPQLTAKHNIHGYTPGYMANPPQALWIQSPYMSTGQNQYHQKKTPSASRRKLFHNITPASGMGQYLKGGKKSGKISKYAHTKGGDIIKEKQLPKRRR